MCWPLDYVRNIAYERLLPMKPSYSLTACNSPRMIPGAALDKFCSSLRALGECEIDFRRQWSAALRAHGRRRPTTRL
jgi:hypothetical protein